jgi:hypothetical protein
MEKNNNKINDIDKVALSIAALNIDQDEDPGSESGLS